MSETATQELNNAAGKAEEMPNLNILLAGFGGQGILFTGKLIAYAGLLDDREVSWLPSYGPEMRGGTANCSVCLSNEPIGSPLVTEPDVLLALNLPSFDSFIDHVKPGGLVIVDSTLVDETPERSDVRFEPINATELAQENGLQGLANVVALGKLLALTNFSSVAAVESAIEKSVSAKKQDMIAFNKQALSLGFNFVSKD